LRFSFRRIRRFPPEVRSRCVVSTCHDNSGRCTATTVTVVTFVSVVVVVFAAVSRRLQHVEAVRWPQGVCQAAASDHRWHGFPGARHVYHGRATRVLHNGDGNSVRGQSDPVHRGRAAHQAGKHVLLDHVHVHHAGRVPKGTGRGRRAPRRWARKRRTTQVLYVLPVGVLRSVLPGHVVLLPQVVMGHAGGCVDVHTGHGPAVRTGRRERARKAEENTRPLHAHPHQSEYLPFAHACAVYIYIYIYIYYILRTRGSRFWPTFASLLQLFFSPRPFLKQRFDGRIFCGCHFTYMYIYIYCLVVTVLRA